MLISSVMAGVCNRRTVNPYIWINILLAVVYAVFAVTVHIKSYPDTTTYIDAWSVIKTFTPDTLRTPVYPMIIGPLVSAFGFGVASVIVVLIQWVVFCLTLLPFRRICEYFISNKYLSVFCYLLYGLYLPTFFYNSSLITESLSYSLSVVLIYFVLKYRLHSNNRLLCVICCIMLLTIFLRPAMLFVLIVISVYGLYRYIVLKEVQYKRLLAATALCGLLALSYSFAMYQNYGCFTFSRVSVFNDFISLRNDNIVSINDIAAYDDEIREYMIDSNVNELDSLTNKFGEERIYKNMSKITGEHRLELLMLVKNHFISSLNCKVIALGYNAKADIINIFLPSFWLLYLVLIVFSVIVCLSRLMRKMLADYILLIMMLLGLILVVLYGAYAEYDRLIYPCSWALYLMGFILIDKFIYHYAKKG